MTTYNLSVKDRCKAYVQPGKWCAGWVEIIEPKRIGVRLVNGNFRWFFPDDVRPHRQQSSIDLFGG